MKHDLPRQDEQQAIMQKTPRKAAGILPDFTIGGRGVGDLSGGMIAPPLVSFVVICWNYAKYVGAALDSIRRQDYPHFECLVIDNGSTDGSGEVIAKHVAGDARFTVETLPHNLGQLGAALWSLGKIKGGFVTFVDADDVLFDNYASTHVQAHMALPRNVAFTSSNVAEMDAQGNTLASATMYVDISRDNLTPGLRKEQSVLRVPTIAPNAYDMLCANVATAPRWIKGWLWGPGTANMYRASMLKLAQRGDSNAAPHMRSADGYFNFLCHGFAGSALIAMTLSGYRLHTANYFSTRENFPSLRSGTSAYDQKAREATLTDIDFLLSNTEKFSWVLGEKFWDVIDQITRIESNRLRDYYRNQDLFKLFLQHAPTLGTHFDERVFCREVTARFSGWQAHRILQSGCNEKPTLRHRLRLATRLMRYEIRRLRKRR
ncbi:glycosyltransferase family 2 protein [Aminobacter sp. HY435]|uniref:glycosyltransferase family 2 protein n=1 Tax=Aminobacter sp. HY435 TaxID=2970917 RepID=UPI0022B97FBB|nr:glycosyltransferase family A protein [Aminobacter sp. HY435]